MLHPVDGIALELFLSEYRNRHVLYYPNPGNAGDSMIQTATEQLMDRLGINFQRITMDDNVEGQIVFLGGGGNLIPKYNDIASAFKTMLGKAREIILLPHTIRGNEDLLATLTPSCSLICRDPVSYQHALECAGNAFVMLSHDLAFHLDHSRILRQTAYQNFFLSRLRETGIEWASAKFKENASFFRDDAESTGRHADSDLDPAAVFGDGWPDNPERSSWCLLEVVRTLKQLRTDRLHVAIAAALLDVPCELYDNSYGKNSAIYQHSIRGRFPHVILR